MSRRRHVARKKEREDLRDHRRRAVLRSVRREAIRDSGPPLSERAMLARLEAYWGEAHQGRGGGVDRTVRGPRDGGRST